MKKKTYYWLGTNSQGTKQTGEITAFSENLAHLKLARNGINVVSLQKKSFFQLPHKRTVTALDIALFFRQLATLVSAGVPINQAIHILSQNAEHDNLSVILNRIQEAISSGKHLAYGLKQFHRHFDEITCHLVQNGEQTGTLDLILERIAQHKEKTISLKHKIKQALFYPAMIIFVAMIVSSIMLTCVVPRFAELFQSTHSKLPGFTLAVICLSQWFRHCFGWILLFLIIIVGGVIYFRETPRIQKSHAWLMLNFPGIRSVIKKIILARFARNLATIFAAGIPLTEALNMVSSITGNLFYRQAIQHTQLAIATGKQFHMAIANNALFPPMMLQMIQIGEESGTLDKMLAKIADFYEADIDRIVTNLSKLLEPLIMVILGALIGGLVIAMYLPIFKLGTVI